MHRICMSYSIWCLNKDLVLLLFYYRGDVFYNFWLSKIMEVNDGFCFHHGYARYRGLAISLCNLGLLAMRSYVASVTRHSSRGVQVLTDQLDNLIDSSLRQSRIP
jgi:hypothetical protein